MDVLTDGLARGFLTKLARIFGEQPDEDVIHNPLLPHRDRVHALRESIGRKAKEPKTSWTRALLSGGLGGAAAGGLGAALGAASTRELHPGKSALLGAGVGTVLGAGLGASFKHRDDGRLARARYLQKRPHLHHRELNELSAQHQADERQDEDWSRQQAEMAAERRHDEMMRELRNRSQS